MTLRFALGVVVGTLVIAVGASALAIGLALAQAGHSLFGIGSTELTVIGAVSWANGVVVMALSRRVYRGPTKMAVGSGPA